MPPVWGSELLSIAPLAPKEANMSNLSVSPFMPASPPMVSRPRTSGASCERRSNVTGGRSRLNSSITASAGLRAGRIAPVRALWSRTSLRWQSRQDFST